ncbi:hypothetical protein I540_6075 [Mycobacteroides abscessus subsp. bolletii 1513]|uniref:Uncharacterized protein n=1 Tax=Mycobacteroides abscessus subsp. bolletii 1513 TaxID=1299321 RepID=X8DB91_9MYCO|nr:hypothetical protein I540_6075 [Mycobacteroides abscessus subsp. bolletii 1513]
MHSHKPARSYEDGRPNNRARNAAPLEKPLTIAPHSPSLSSN